MATQILCLSSPRKLGKIPILTHIFQKGLNSQLGGQLENLTTCFVDGITTTSRFLFYVCRLMLKISMHAVFCCISCTWYTIQLQLLYPGICGCSSGWCHLTFSKNFYTNRYLKVYIYRVCILYIYTTSVYRKHILRSS